jgi:hypothetical protein
MAATTTEEVDVEAILKREEQRERLEKLRTFVALLAVAFITRGCVRVSAANRLLQRLSTELGYGPLAGKSPHELAELACAELERELYGAGAPPAPKGDTWG